MARFLERPRVKATCPKCHVEFLVEGDATGTPFCPDCGEDVAAPPPAPRTWGLAAPVGAVCGLLVVCCGLWLVQGVANRPEEPPPTKVDAEPRPAVTYRPSYQLPELAVQEPRGPLQPPPGNLSPKDFSATSSGVLLAQAAGAKAEPKTEPKAADPKQPEGAVDVTSPATAELKELADAIAAFRRQDLPAARALLEQAAQAHPELPPVPFMMGELHLAANQILAGRQELEQAAAKFPRFAGTYLLFANLALAEGRITDATLELEKARSLEAEVTDPKRRAKIQAAIRMSLVSVSEVRQDWSAARDAAEQWLSFEPTNSRARAKLAKSLLAMNKPQEAIRELERAAAEDKDQQPPEAAMAAFYTELADSKSAEDWLQKALVAHPKNFKVAMFAAAWYLERDRAAEARPLATKAQELDPTSVDAKLMCAVVARQLRNLRDAEKWLELAMRDAPASFSVSNQLALVLAEQEDDLKRRRAMELAEVNARQYPRSVDAASTLGWAYYRGGKIEQAEQALQAAVSGGRASSDTAYFFAHVLAERGRLDAAAKLLQDAINATGPFTHRAEAKKWLDRITARPGTDVGKEPAKAPPAKEAAKEPTK